MKRLIELDSLEMRVELKRIGRKARRFIARNKRQKAVFRLDLGEHLGTCLSKFSNHK